MSYYPKKARPKTKNIENGLRISFTIMASVVHIKRKNGEIIQNCDVYIGRRVYMGGWRLEQSKWANPFKTGKDGTISEILEKYRNHVLSKPELSKDLSSLKNKVLGCWCKPKPCHGDILVELVNQTT